MNLRPSVAELQKEHVVMEVECIDRIYLNAYVPPLTTEAGVAGFVRGYLGHRFASTKQVAEKTESFVLSILQFALFKGVVVDPLGIFVGQQEIEKCYTKVFEVYPSISHQTNKLKLLYKFGGYTSGGSDVCGFVSFADSESDGVRSIIYTTDDGTWKVRVMVSGVCRCLREVKGVAGIGYDTEGEDGSRHGLRPVS